MKLTEAQRAARKLRSVTLKDAIQSLVEEHQVKIAKIATENGR